MMLLFMAAAYLTGGYTQKKEALKFEEDLNRKYNIPDTDGLEMREEWEKRKRSDKPGPKISRVGTIKE